MKRPDRVFLAILVAAAILRLTLLATSQDGVIGDEATTGLMAMDVMRGRRFPLYAYGYSYNGGAAITAFVAAPLFRVAGVSAFTLKLVPLGISLLYMWVAHVFARRYFGRRAALWTAFLLLVDPGYLQWNLDARGGQVVHLLITVLLAFLACRMYFEGEARALHAFLFGLVAGVGYWNFPYILPLAASASLMLVLGGGRRFLARRLPVMALGALAGLTPVLLHCLSAGPSALAPSPTLRPAVLLRNLADLARIGLPALFSPLNTVNVSFVYSKVLLAVSLVCVVWLAVAERRGAVAWARSLAAWGRRMPPCAEEQARVWPMIAFLPAYVFVVLATPNGGREARYLLPAYPFLTLLTAIAVARMARGAGMMRCVAWVAVAAFAACGIWAHGDFLTRPAETVEDKIRLNDGHMLLITVRSEDVRALVRFLETEDIRFVYTSAELRSKLMFASRGRIQATSERLTEQYDFLPAATAAVEAGVGGGRPYGFVFRRDMLLYAKARRDPGVARRWAAFLERARNAGETARRKDFSGLVLYYGFGREARTMLP